MVMGLHCTSVIVYGDLHNKENLEQEQVSLNLQNNIFVWMLQM